MVEWQKQSATQVSFNVQMISALENAASRRDVDPNIIRIWRDQKVNRKILDPERLLIQYFF